MPTGQAIFRVFSVASFLLLSGLFFFDIIGVFGLIPAIVGLGAFVSSAFWIFRAFPAEGGVDDHR